MEDQNLRERVADTIPDDVEPQQFVPSEDLVSYDIDQLDADDLYDVRREAEFIDAVALAARIEIERRNALAFDGYQPTFGTHELVDVGMVLMAAKRHRIASGSTGRSKRITELAETFNRNIEVTHPDYVTTNRLVPWFIRWSKYDRTSVKYREYRGPAVRNLTTS